jgi:hypothetical protein
MYEVTLEQSENVVQQMKKNGLLQTFFYDFLKIQVTNWVQEILVTFENQSSMTKVTSAS